MYNYNTGDKNGCRSSAEEMGKLDGSSIAEEPHKRKGIERERKTGHRSSEESKSGQHVRFIEEEDVRARFQEYGEKGLDSIKTFFFDTYAFYELIEGNARYKPYSKDIAIITTRLNLMELHYGLLLKHGKEKADEYYNKLLPFCIEISDEAIKKANELKAGLKKRKLSYVDCIGYVLAKMRNVKFLTGDKEFSDMDDVEFVK